MAPLDRTSRGRTREPTTAATSRPRLQTGPRTRPRGDAEHTGKGEEAKGGGGINAEAKGKDGGGISVETEGGAAAASTARPSTAAA